MIASLKDLFGEKVSFDPTILEIHGKDTSYPEVLSPEAVVFAESVEDVLRSWPGAMNTGHQLSHSGSAPVLKDILPLFLGRLASIAPA